jgi:Glycosyltransferase like family 2
MKRTITVAAWRRPKYLLQVLESLDVALRLCPEYSPAQITIGIDHSGSQEQDEVNDVAKWLTYRYPNVKIINWLDHLGVSEAPRRLLQYTFTELKSDFNLHLEDDTVLSPDALRLVCWYSADCYFTEHAYFPFLCLHSRSTEITTDPSALTIRQDFGVWGWACHTMSWRTWIAPYWNHKRERPIGWDYSLSHTMNYYRLPAISPALSRVRNIGREGGVYQTPEGWYEEQRGLVTAGRCQEREIKDFQLIYPASPLVWPEWTQGE